MAKIEAQITPELVETATKVNDFAAKHGINIKSIRGRKEPQFWFIEFFPLFILAWLNGILPYRFTKKFIKKNIKDPAFDASIKVIFGLFLYPIFWGLMALALLLAGVSGWWVLGYLGFSLLTCTMSHRVQFFFTARQERKHREAISKKFPEDYTNFTNGLQELNEFRQHVLLQ